MQTHDRREMLGIKIASLAHEQRLIRRKERAAKRQARAARELLKKEAQGAGEEVRYSGHLGNQVFRAEACRQELEYHRKHVVRRELRYAHVAMGFLRGRMYRQIEQKCHEPIDPIQLAGVVLRFQRKPGGDPQTHFGMSSSQHNFAYTVLKPWLKAKIVEVETQANVAADQTAS